MYNVIGNKKPEWAKSCFKPGNIRRKDVLILLVLRDHAAENMAKILNRPVKEICDTIDNAISDGSLTFASNSDEISLVATEKGAAAARKFIQIG